MKIEIFLLITVASLVGRSNQDRSFKKRELTTTTEKPIGSLLCKFTCVNLLKIGIKKFKIIIYFSM